MNWEIGHIYKVRANWRGFINFPSKRKDYYCIVLYDTYYRNTDCGLVTYIPNMFVRPLTDNCELDSRLSYVGSFEDYGHLLFDQKNLIISGNPTIMLFSKIVQC